MKVFRRSSALSHRSKSRTTNQGTVLFRRNEPHQEDEEHLLESNEGKGHQLFYNPYEELLPILLQEDDHERKTAELESCCTRLEARCMGNQEQPQTREQYHQREVEDREMLATMKVMKDYIHKLEQTNDLLMAESHSATGGSSGSGSSANDPITKSNQQGKKRIAKAKGADWNLVCNLARKLSDIKKENLKLKNLLVAKAKETDQILVLTSSLHAKLEEAQYENERLATKCKSLEEAASDLLQEIEAPTNVKIDNDTDCEMGTKSPKTTYPKIAPSTSNENNFDETNPSRKESLKQVENLGNIPCESSKQIAIQTELCEGSDGHHQSSDFIQTTSSYDELDKILSEIMLESSQELDLSINDAAIQDIHKQLQV